MLWEWEKCFPNILQSLFMEEVIQMSKLFIASSIDKSSCREDSQEWRQR